MEQVKLRSAETEDLKLVQQLLLDCELPYQDIANHLPDFIVAKNGTQLVGVIGLEPLNGVGLLRSLAVAGPHRGKGLAKALYTRIVAHAQRKRIKRLYLLTLTAAGFFSKLGFAKIDRENVPTALQGTEEFRSLCPDTAVCMVKEIGSET
jgi:amino-acid N-acetyltransferase